MAFGDAAFLGEHEPDSDCGDCVVLFCLSAAVSSEAILARCGEITAGWCAVANPPGEARGQLCGKKKRTSDTTI